MKKPPTPKSKLKPTFQAVGIKSQPPRRFVGSAIDCGSKTAKAL